MFSVLFLITISSYILYDAAEGSNLNLSASISSKLLSNSYRRDNGWTVYTTMRPEPSHNPFFHIKDVINGHNNNIQFSRILIHNRNTMPSNNGSSRYGSTSQLRELANHTYPNDHTNDLNNTNYGTSLNFKRISSMYKSDAIPRRETARRRSSLSLHTPDILESFPNSKVLSHGVNRTNRTNQIIRRMHDSDISKRSNSTTHSSIPLYTEERLELPTNLKKQITNLLSTNNRNNQFIRNTSSIYDNSSVMSSENSKMYGTVSRNIPERNMKQESDVQNSSVSRKRCILSPGDKKRKCLKKVKRKKLKSNIRSNAFSEKTSTVSPEKNQANLRGNDTTVSKSGSNERQKQGEVINNISKQQGMYSRIGIDVNRYAASDIPCTCHWNPQNCGCDCEGSLNYDNFMNLSQLFRPCQNFTFTMREGHFYALPPNLFHKINAVDNFHIYVINSSFEYLLDPTPMTSAFTGVHFHHHAFVNLDKVSVRRGWNWSPFQKLKGSPGARVHVMIKNSILKRLTSDFSNFANGQVESIDVADSSLEMIGSGAFQTFVNMTNFHVPSNKISHLHRMDFPKMCSKLEEIDLRNNQLQSLEDGLFAAMPSLKEIKLAGNPLRMLSEKTFQEIITRVNLQGISGFPLICDCHLQWLKNPKMEDNGIIKENMNGATCKRPGHLRGTPFNFLSKEHLVC